MKKLLLGICFSLLISPLLAQTRQVKVTDKSNGQPLEGVSIELPNGQVVLTDKNGLASIPEKTPSFILTAIGYKSTQGRSTADLTAIQLERQNLFLQPVEVKATRASEQAPFAKTNISQKEISKQNLGQDIPFLLNQTPSVVVSSDAGNGVGYTGIRIRGTDATRINVTLNGIPYNDAESQGVFFVNLPDFASSVSSVQVQRGVGTSSNGAGAFGATLSMSTNEFREEAYAEFNNSYGSFNTWKNTIKAGSGLISDHFTIDARLSRISSDGYIDRASSDLKSFYLSTAYLSGKSSLRLNVFSGKEKTYQAWYGIPQSEVGNCRTCNIAGTERPGEPYDNETDNYQQDHYQLFFNHSASEKLSFNIATFLTRGRGYYEQYKADEGFGKYGLQPVTVGNETITSTDLIRQLWLDNYYYGTIYSLQYKHKKTQLTFGGGYNRYDGQHYGKVIWGKIGVPDNHKWYDLDALKTDFSVYGKWQQQLGEKWESFVDLQLRNVRYDIEGFRDNPTLATDNRYNFFNPKLGISYRHKNWSAYASFGVANKEPNRDDFEAGATQQPRHETLYDVELGLEKKTSTYTLGANLFYMHYRDQLVLTGKVNDVGAYTRTNIPKSYRLGVELQASAKLTSWMKLAANLTLSENKVIDFTEFLDDYDNGGQKEVNYNKSDIAFSPAVVGGATLYIYPVSNAEIAVISKYVGRQYLDNTGKAERSLDPYYVQDLRLSYTLSRKLAREVNFIFQVNNLFNKLYEPNGYTFSYIYNNLMTTENYVYPMAGINWMAGLNIRL
ncbi:TonB-dependent receptor [Flavihumibacter rivuli]|uniref:TonB-dependent receptor n=1 Tax=Flavihumibacter rivuli TaxID=2838156 RepID=UPI001BDE2F36|nr:TonB-dependent receptor plug domain-containing protein [Flavihumibacter rivuli]ULQ56682.1 TonB-dependent receptor [Flavihumibacter rivuli]